MIPSDMALLSLEQVMAVVLAKNSGHLCDSKRYFHTSYTGHPSVEK